MRNGVRADRVRSSKDKRARDDPEQSPLSQSSVPDAQRRMVRLLSYPNANPSQAAEKATLNPTLTAFVRALARKAAREWLRRRSDDSL